jgi:hypothetical protein
MMGRTARKRLADYEAICRKLVELGGLREPELAAALGWEEDRVYAALREPLKLGWLTRRCDNREVMILPPLRGVR